VDFKDRREYVNTRCISDGVDWVHLSEKVSNNWECSNAIVLVLYSPP
jgi:hypothetical protein